MGSLMAAWMRVFLYLVLQEMDDRQSSESHAVTTVLGRIITFISDSVFDQYPWPNVRAAHAYRAGPEWIRERNQPRALCAPSDKTCVL